MSDRQQRRHQEIRVANARCRRKVARPSRSERDSGTSSRPSRFGPSFVLAVADLGAEVQLDQRDAAKP